MPRDPDSLKIFSVALTKVRQAASYTKRNPITGSAMKHILSVTIVLALVLRLAAEEEQCIASGCSAASPAADRLAPAEIQVHLESIACEPVGTPSLALETLLFHAPDVTAYLDTPGATPLSDEQTVFLREELRRRHAMISLRVVDAENRVRIELEEPVPIGEKQHLHPDKTDDVAPPEVSFTVQRVGLYHLWTRI